MSDDESVARALLAADDTFSYAEGRGEPRTWESLSEDTQLDYRIRAAAFLKTYSETLWPTVLRGLGDAHRIIPVGDATAWVVSTDEMVHSAPANALGEHE